MIVPYWLAPRRRMMLETGSKSLLTGELTMKWETPEAIDMRFGMEITMYISNR